MFMMNLLVRLLNPLVVALLRSPLHSLLSGNTMLVSFTGRRSGKRYTVPISYVREDDTIICFTGSPWWKNLRGGAPVVVRVRGQDLDGSALPIDGDPGAISQGIQALLRRVPRDASFYGVTLNSEGIPDQEQVDRAARRITMIRIQLPVPQLVRQ
jgi:hypothetical protein